MVQSGMLGEAMVHDILRTANTGDGSEAISGARRELGLAGDGGAGKNGNEGQKHRETHNEWIKEGVRREDEMCSLCT
jgi:hypothetical protein